MPTNVLRGTLAVFTMALALGSTACGRRDDSTLTVLMNDPSSHLCFQHTRAPGPDGPDSHALTFRVFHGDCPARERDGDPDQYWWEMRVVGDEGDDPRKWHAYYVLGQQPNKAPAIWRSSFRAEFGRIGPGESVSTSAARWVHEPGVTCSMGGKDWPGRSDGTCWAADGGFTPRAKETWGIVPEWWGP